MIPPLAEQRLVLLPAQAVAEVDRDAEGWALSLEPLGADRQQVGDPGQGHGDRVQVDASDMADDARDRLRRCDMAGLFGRRQIAADSPEQEGSRAARRVENALFERLGDRLLDHALGEPVGV